MAIEARISKALVFVAPGTQTHTHAGRESSLLGREWKSRCRLARRRLAGSYILKRQRSSASATWRAPPSHRAPTSGIARRAPDGLVGMRGFIAPVPRTTLKLEVTDNSTTTTHAAVLWLKSELRAALATLRAKPAPARARPTSGIEFVEREPWLNYPDRRATTAAKDDFGVCWDSRAQTRALSRERSIENEIIHPFTIRSFFYNSSQPPFTRSIY